MGWARAGFWRDFLSCTASCQDLAVGQRLMMQHDSCMKNLHIEYESDTFMGSFKSRQSAWAQYRYCVTGTYEACNHEKDLLLLLKRCVFSYCVLVILFIKVSKYSKGSGIRSGRVIPWHVSEANSYQLRDTAIKLTKQWQQLHFDGSWIPQTTFLTIGNA